MDSSFQVIARIVDGSTFDEFKALYGDTLVTGKFYQLQFFFKCIFIQILNLTISCICLFGF